MYLYRAVSSAEYAQIKRTGDFQLGGGAEGKYFWERRSDAEMFAFRYNLPHIVRARYSRAASSSFFRWLDLDGLGPARFADEDEMNSELLEIKTS